MSETKKVYCEECKHIYHYNCRATKKMVDNPIMIINEYQSCFTKNLNNDCKLYTPTLLKRIKDLLWRDR